MNTKNKLDKIKQCLSDDPDMSIEKISKQTRISVDEVSELMCTLAIQAETKYNESGNKLHMTTNNHIDIVKTLESDPFRVFSDGLDSQINELLSDNKKNFDKRFELVRPIMINKIYNDLEKDKQFALKKMEACAKEGHYRGSRWLELKIKTEMEQAKLLGLEPDKNNNVKVTIGRSKEELDAIYQASMINMYGETIDVCESVS